MDTQKCATLTGLLDLEGFEVAEMTQDASRKVRRLAVVPMELAGLCPHCDRVTLDRHACCDWEIMDLPLGGWNTELVVRGWQFHCQRCDKFFTPRQPALAPGTHATVRLLDRLAELVKCGDVSAVARFFGIPERTAERWYYDWLERKRKEPAKDLLPIRSLGIDEISLKKDIASSAAS